MHGFLASPAELRDLGDKLHAAVLTGVVSKHEMRRLFEDPLPEGRAEQLYLTLSARLASIEHDMPERAERF